MARSSQGVGCRVGGGKMITVDVGKSKGLFEEEPLLQKTQCGKAERGKDPEKSTLGRENKGKDVDMGRSLHI